MPPLVRGEQAAGGGAAGAVVGAGGGAAEWVSVGAGLGVG